MKKHHLILIFLFLGLFLVSVVHKEKSVVFNFRENLKHHAQLIAPLVWSFDTESSNKTIELLARSDNLLAVHVTHKNGNDFVSFENNKDQNWYETLLIKIKLIRPFSETVSIYYEDHEIAYFKATRYNENIWYYIVVVAFFVLSYFLIRAYEVIQISSKNYSEIFNSSNDGILVYDHFADKLVDANNKLCELYGHQKNDVLQMNFSTFCASEFPYTEEKANEWVFKTLSEGIQVFPWRAKKNNGDYFWVEISLKSCMIGDVQRILVVVRDITERKKVEQQLIEVSRLAGMSEVATGVLHNVGNILNSVNISTHVLFSRMKGSNLQGFFKGADLIDEHSRDFTNFILHSEKGKLLSRYFVELSKNLKKEYQLNLKEIEGLIGNLENITSIVNIQLLPKGRFDVIEDVLLGDLIQETLRVCLNEITHHNIKVEHNYVSNIYIHTDKWKVFQILANLIKNAISALSSNTLSRNKILRFEVKALPNSNIEIQVIDTGIGIAPDDLNKIFQYGFTTKKDGHGFGLHTSLIAAKQIGGILTVKSDGLGKGATFSLQIPLRLKDPEVNESI